MPGHPPESLGCLAGCGGPPPEGVGAEAPAGPSPATAAGAYDDILVDDGEPPRFGGGGH
jgi:hypothetical protein